MRIIISTDQIYLHGGIEKVLSTKANYWSNQSGVEVYIVTTEQKGNTPCYPMDSRVHLIDLGINYNRSRSYFSKENMKKAIKHFREQKKLFRQLKPDAIISPNFNFDHYWLPNLKAGAKLIKEIHGSRYKDQHRRKNASFAKKIQFLISDWAESRYSHIVVLNEDEKEYIRTGNAEVIPNPIELQAMRADLDNKKVIAAGRISPVKGFGEMIESWALIYKENPDWQLHLYGDDYLGTKGKLELQINNLGLKDAVVFKGSVDNLTEKMADYSLYAMTSETECFPMVLLEAMSVGLPIVSYDCPNGPRNIIKDGEDGLLVPHHRTDRFAEEMLKLMNNESLRKQLGTAAQKNAARFSTDEVMKKWQTLLNLPNV